jgi:hypothetical protein
MLALLDGMAANAAAAGDEYVAELLQRLRAVLVAAAAGTATPDDIAEQLGALADYANQHVEPEIERLQALSDGPMPMLRLLGDRHQLTAVGRGGVLDLAAGLVDPTAAGLVRPGRGGGRRGRA